MGNLLEEMLTREGKELPNPDSGYFPYGDSDFDEGDAELFGRPKDDEVSLRLVIECSGICEPNPEGIGAWGFTIMTPNRHLIDVHLGDTGKGEENTNNALEYVALLFALTWTAEFAPNVPVEIRSSSKTVVEQVNGNFQCRAESLRPLHESAVELIRQTKATLRWISINENQTAYFLARAAFGNTKKRLEAEGNE